MIVGIQIYFTNKKSVKKFGPKNAKFGHFRALYMSFIAFHTFIGISFISGEAECKMGLSGIFLNKPKISLIG